MLSMASTQLSFSHFSANSTYPSSKSFQFSIPLPKIQSFPHYKAKKTKFYCSSQTVQSDKESQTNQTKKKKKLRPSFLEQVQDKWSVKNTSLRQKFPWQEQECQFPVGKNEEIFEVDDSLSSGSRFGVKLAPLVNGNKPKNAQLGSESIDFKKSVEENEEISEFDESLSSGSKVKLAPWVNRNQPKKSQLDYESRGLEKSVDDRKIVGKFENSVSSEVQKALNKGVDFDYDEVDETPLDLGFKDGNLTRVSEELCSDSVEQTKVSHGSFSDSYSNDEKGVGYTKDSVRLPWQSERDVERVGGDKLRKGNAELAEKSIPEPQLKRLRNAALRMVERIKVGSAGVTQELVDTIHEKWKVDEIVKLRFEGPPSHNMRRTHEILEHRTGGLVIWRSGSSIVLYRGMSYKLPCVRSFTTKNHDVGEPEVLNNDSSQRVEVKSLNQVAERPRNSFSNLSGEEITDLSELNMLLDEVGPRFKDWSGREPLPVDADLLPAVVPGYRPPFRRLPYGVKANLKNQEMTYLRRTARIMPPHFALGRNRELQGLAAAIVKLWRRSAIAKIAIKRGVQNTRNERMAEELKVLTGGTLLSRNKDYIVFYRGNDFLPPRITEALVEAERKNDSLQDQEEQARRAATPIHTDTKASNRPLVAGTLSETLAATSRWGHLPSTEEREKMMRDAAVARHASLVKYLEEKLALAKGKVRKAENMLRKLQENREPSELPTDLETLSDEERFLFRKMGLSMKPFLLLGRRDVFDGTIENIHLHWKYRELVKIIVERRNTAQIKHIAITLEAESGGVLVSIDKTLQGYAVILYRGKNYQRPSVFRPKNLLTKRQALARSIELQRREALKHHITELQDKIQNLKSEIEDMDMVDEIDEEYLYSRLDASDDEDDIEESEAKAVPLRAVE